MYVSSIRYPECFFQSLPHHNINTNTGPGICSKENGFDFQFSLNSAKYSGVSLFKSGFGKCSINGKLFEELVVISSLSNIQTSDIGSFQVQICYCSNSIPDCTKQIPFIDIKTGDKIALDIVIMDKGNHPVNGSVMSEVKGSVLIRDDQKFRDVMNGCTPLTIDIYSFQYSQQLIMLPWFEEDSFYLTTESSKDLLT